MSKIKVKNRPMKKVMFFVFFSIFLTIILFISNTINVYANTNEIELVHHHRGNSDTCGECFTTPIYHSHQGDSISGGSCFSPVYHTHNSSCYSYTTCTMYPRSISVASENSTYCSYHGPTTEITYNVSYYHDYENCYGTGNVTVHCTACGGVDVYAITSHYISQLSCGKNSSSIDSYTLNCPKSLTEDIDGYAPSCGLEENTSYGKIQFSADNDEWTSGNVNVSASLDDYNGILTQNGYGQFDFSTDNGNIVTTGASSIEVSENGNYYVRISVDEALFDTSDAEVMIQIKNIDRTPPQIEDIEYDSTSKYVSQNTVTVIATDKQPDNSEGSGLAAEAFSFDGGNTFQSENNFTYSKNGTYTIVVRDNCGNEASKTLVINNIDSAPPVLSYDLSPNPWYTHDDIPRVITINASDDEIGLHETPYSYDGGNTWVADNKIISREEGVFTVYVRDAFENISMITIHSYMDYIPYVEPDNKESDSDEEAINDLLEKKLLPEAEEAILAIDEIDQSNDNSKITNTNESPLKNIETPVSAPFDSENNQDKWAQKNNEIINSPKTTTSPRNIISDIDASIKKTYPFGLPLTKKVVQTTGCVLAILTLLFSALLLFSTARIYSFDGKKYHFVGITPIYKSENGHTMTLSQSVYDRSFSSRFIIKPGMFFAKSHANGLLSIKHKKRIDDVIISKCIVYDFTPRE